MLRGKELKLLGAALTATAVNLSAPVAALSLKDAIIYVLETNPEITAAESSKQAIEFELDQARSLRMPRIDLEARGDASLNDGTTSVALTAADDALPGYEFSARISQNLWDGWETRSEIERQAYRVDSAALRVLERSEFLGLEAVRLYLEVLRLADVVKLADDNLTYHREVLTRIQGAYDQGVVGIGDLQQAEERVYLAEDTLTLAQLDLTDAKIFFLEVVGVEATRLQSVSDISGSVPSTLEKTLAAARVKNPTFRFMQADVGAAEALSRVIDANKYPSLNLEAEARYGEDMRGFEGNVRDARIGLVLRYSLQGSSNRANRQEHVRRVSEARANLLTTSRQVERQARLTWSNLRTVRRRIVLIREQARLSAELRASYEAEFEIGNRSLLDVLNTQASLFQAEVDLATAKSLETFAEYRVLAAVGILLPTLGIEPPEDAQIYARDEQGAPGVSAAENQGRFDAKSFSSWRAKQGN